MKEWFHQLFYYRTERDDDVVVLRQRFRPHRPYPCGHVDTDRYKTIVYGLSFSGTSELCPNCSANQHLQVIIRCVNCGLPIVPTQMVAVVLPVSGDLKKSYAKFVNDDTGVVICCRPGCFHGDFTGFWNGSKVDMPTLRA